MSAHLIESGWRATLTEIREAGIQTIAEMAGGHGHGGAVDDAVARAPSSKAHNTRRAKGRAIVSTHGCRINPRDGIPMHIMATHALQLLPGNRGTINDLARQIEGNQTFAKHLDWTPRPGTKTYPRCVSL